MHMYPPRSGWPGVRLKTLRPSLLSPVLAHSRQLEEQVENRHEDSYILEWVLFVVLYE